MAGSRDAEVESVEGVCDVERMAARGVDPRQRADLLIELPHGATDEAQYAALRARLRGRLPRDLECFFFVNTDAGAPECARSVAARVIESAEESGRSELPATDRLPVRSVWIVRSLIPRTFIDCNRVVDAEPAAAALTPAIPPYVADPHDIQLLRELHESYQRTAREAYKIVCGAGGLALTLHTYAPRSVGIDRLDDLIVERLRLAYRAEVYSTWPIRPQVDLITETVDGRKLAPLRLAAAVRDGYARSGIEAAENATYRLHEGTMGLVHSLRHPGRVLCLEINRELLTAEFRPFVPLVIDPQKVDALALPLAVACVAAWSGGDGD